MGIALGGGLGHPLTLGLTPPEGVGGEFFVSYKVLLQYHVLSEVLPLIGVTSRRGR